MRWTPLAPERADVLRRGTACAPGAAALPGTGLGYGGSGGVGAWARRAARNRPGDGLPFGPRAWGGGGGARARAVRGAERAAHDRDAADAVRPRAGRSCRCAGGVHRVDPDRLAQAV